MARRKKKRKLGDLAPIDKALVESLRECRAEASTDEREACKRGAFKVVSKLRG